MSTSQIDSAQEIRRLRMSYEEYLQWAGEDTRAEWVDGEVIVYMPPRDEHQRIVEFLHTLLSLFVSVTGLGLVRLAPFEVKLWEGGPAREPDLFFVSKERLAALSSERFSGAPDLVAEVLSAGTLYIDRNEKFREYERAGVREYWLIDSRPGHARADFYRLDEEGRFALVATEVEERVGSSALENFWLRPAWLWQTPQPNPLLALAEITGKGALIELLQSKPD
jgi:Uma2 family endonuclease